MRTELKAIRETINEVLKEVEKKHGFTVDTDYRISYEWDGSKFRITGLDFLRTEGMEDKIAEETKLEFMRVANKQGVDHKYFNALIKIQNKIYRVIGGRPRATVKSFRIQDINTGTEYITTASTILSAEVVKYGGVN